jgi:hypothetical protein
VKKSRRIIPNNPPVSALSSVGSRIPSEIKTNLDSLKNQALAPPREGNLILLKEWTPIATSNIVGTKNKNKLPLKFFYLQNPIAERLILLLCSACQLCLTLTLY